MACKIVPPSPAPAASAAGAVPVFPLVSTGAPWPGAADWRPRGWRTDLTPAEVAEALRDFNRGDDGRWLRRGVDLARVKADAALLRDCWTTPLWGWQLAAEVLGPPAVDPFWNPWSQVHEAWPGVRLLDGCDGRDGFDVRLWGKGAAFVNGPHSDNAGTMRAVAAHVLAGNSAAMIAPLDGCDWVQGATAVAEGDAAEATEAAGGATVAADFASADLIVLLGRVRFRPPPGVDESSPRGAYWLGLWGVSPEDCEALSGRRVWVPEAGREVVFTRGAGDLGQPSSAERRAAVAQKRTARSATKAVA